MAFRESLKNVVEKVDGAIGAVVMGFDGIAIDEYVSEASLVDVQLMAIEYASLLKDIRKTIEILNSGEMQEVSITTDNYRVVARPVSDDFFLALVLDANGNFGKGRYLLKQSVPSIREALQ